MRISILIPLFVCSAFASSAHADDFNDSSDIEPTTPVTGYSIKRTAPSTTPAPTIPPTTSQNMVPIANAGPNQAVFTGALVVLNASESRDSDGAIASYVWKQLSGPPIALLSHRTKHASFTAGGSAASYVFELTVRDTFGAVATDLVTVVVRQNQNIVPAVVFPSDIPPTPIPVPTSLFSTPKILFIALSAILILLVGIVLKVALKSKEP
ncbi:MAG: PKD domain-containing protein [bacterium]|nr:PKD domain-containing protein [bacterium]